MSEPDIARVSEDSETYVLIEEDTKGEESQEELGSEELITVTQVEREESTPDWAAERTPVRKRITKCISLEFDYPVDTDDDDEMESDKENDPRGSPTRSGSKRLDMSKFQGANGAGGMSSPNKRSSMAKRLDTSRFSKFQQDDEIDSPTTERVTRNFTITPAAKRFSASEKPVEVKTDSSKCNMCKKTVYPMEKITADSIVYHTTCFRCSDCNGRLSLGKFAQANGFLYCIHHYSQIFRLKGNYEDGFDGSSSRSKRTLGAADSENGIDNQNENQLSEEESLQFEGAKSLKAQFEKGEVSSVKIKRTVDQENIRRAPDDGGDAPQDRMVSENEPQLRTDVVRSSDPVDDEHFSVGGMRSLRDQFEKGDSGLSSSPAKSYDIQSEIQAVRETEVQSSAGQFSESTPVRKDDVVRSDVPSEEVKTFSGGIRSLKDRFEKGQVSNIDTTPTKSAVNVGSLNDYDPSSVEKGVSENTPVFRDDVVRSSQKADDHFITSGGARSLKARFEQGNISNVEERPKDKIVLPTEIRVEEDQPDNQGGVSESTPIRRDDVARGDSSEEDPGIKQGAARSLRSLFEKGEVHNIEEKPRVPLERSPKSLDELAPSTEGVVENTPLVREDLMRESLVRDEPMNIQSGASRSIKDRFEKGEVESSTEKPKVDIEADLKGEGQVAESKPEIREDLLRESSQLEDEMSTTAGSLRAQWEAGDVVHAETNVQKEELSPKRLSSYYQGEEDDVAPEAETQDAGIYEAESPESNEVVIQEEKELEEEYYPQEDEGYQQEDQEETLEEQAEEEQAFNVVNGEAFEENGNEEYVNGHRAENGFEIEVETPEYEESGPAEDGNLIDIESAPGQDVASWEIKAARAAALQDVTGDEDDGALSVEGGLLLDIDGQVNVEVSAED